MGALTRLALCTLLWLVLTANAATTTRAQGLAKRGCPAYCGNLRIPYPFGTREGCFLNENFRITCHDSDNSSTAFLANTRSVVTNISMEGQLQISGTVARDCYKASGDPVLQQLPRSYLEVPWSIFNISNTRNKFTVIGCDSYAYLLGDIGDKRYRAGCISLCDSIEDVDNKYCSGFGCCQIQIPEGLNNVSLIARSFYNHTSVSTFNLCSYAFVVEETQFKFSSDYVRSIPEDYKFPMSLDWVVGNETCEEAKKNRLNFACHQNECYEPRTGGGYLCKCSDGYEGNPYLPNGCQDIDECKKSPCDQNADCHNSRGSYECSCRRGYKGDGKRSNGTGCIAKKIDFVNVVLGTSIGFLALVLGILMLCLMLRQRQISKLRERYFEQNGGNLLREKLSQREGCGEKVQVFVAEELKKATNNYHESRIVGQGGQGTVYKGILPDGQVVAIKKSRIGDQSQVEPFINEITVLYQINHRNVVKLLGCCLETPVPLLVYEYVTNGTLFDLMHNVSATSFLPWEARLRIAVETAEALSYLHSAASIPIIHRDIKLANILIDENYTAKVSDFGASRLIPSDQAQVTTLVQGTFGYLDPEYMQTGQLTEKSDVYSFGVVLIELLTGQKVVCSKRSEEKKVLAMYFVSLMKEGQLLEILDPRVVNDGNIEHLKEVAALAWRCVRVKGEERPTMKEVAHELAGLQAMPRHPWGKSNVPAEEAEYLLGEFCSTYGNGATSTSNTGYDSINNKIAFELEGARWSNFDCPQYSVLVSRFASTCCKKIYSFDWIVVIVLDFDIIVIFPFFTFTHF